MNRLTRQEQLVLCGVCALLLVGLVVKVYRAARPADAAQTRPVAGEHVKN